MIGNQYHSVTQPDRPNHWELLNEADKQTYDRICAALTAPSNKNKKNKRADEFREILEAITLFENHDEVDKWKRCLVCGVYQFEDGIAVNISALKRLIFKCKSSINGSLKAIGYPNVTYKCSSCEELLKGIPFLRGNTVELRQWTVRYRAPKEEAQNENTEYITPPTAISNFDNVDVSISNKEEKTTNEFQISDIFSNTSSFNWFSNQNSEDNDTYFELF
ncbi:hypothetical protein TVAG_309630 [Trichomonas vaginalis G3]|uniref:Initiator binding domain-containing protein n=1 Tax=Trichomonas vaginalis (strain ATCC PRA-98 / G3) TaxID=412133 RepID=A2FGD9_TRIV3|nr:transcription-initiator DNA-binding domain ibd family [Trichomonas vaginalis G3]EAX96043.1 hypothetical protein TVAG_309630 [Trichomonas vaginalis G3]KAI5491748.1 transcription-initiator DNA-binding domain ibd family [Trichomonas vaginalis G3]|eukprot:XP_001308973.1 hypothetical protein [Trichomonas vaginalis G3]